MDITKMTILVFVFYTVVLLVLMFATSFILGSIVGHFRIEMSYTHVVAWWFAIYFALLAIPWTCFYQFVR